MPAENEELDVFKNRKWRPFVNTLRGGPALRDETVLREFDRCFVPSVRRAFKLLKVRELVMACIDGDSDEVQRLRREHRERRDRAETFADQVVQSCRPGMSYEQAIDAFVHGAAVRILDQAALAVVPSDNFPTIEDYRQASAIWLFRMEPRFAELVNQIARDPARLRVQPQSAEAHAQRLDQQLGWSLLDQRQANKEPTNGCDLSDEDQES